MTTASAPAKFKIIKLKEEEILYKEGDPAQSMYLVKTGVVSIYNQKRGKYLELLRIQAGQLIGELAFFNPTPRTSYAKALVETELIEISFQEVQKDFEKLPVWVKILLNTMSGQVIKYSRELKQFKIADSNDPEAVNADLLRYFSALLQTATLFGTPQGEAGVKIDKSSLKLVCAHISTLSSNRMNVIAKCLGEVEGFTFNEKEDDFILTIASLANFRENIKSLAYYVSSYPHLLFPGTEDAAFLKALAQISRSAPPNGKGLVKIPSSPVITQLKAQGSKANMTTVDSLIQLGVPLQKESGAEGVEITFLREEILALNSVWELLTGVLKQNPLRMSSN